MKHSALMILLLCVLLAASMPRSTGVARSLRPPPQDEPTIVGGQTAAEGQFPWTVAIVRKADGSQFCGGSLIASEWVLTAAHCFYTGATRDTQAQDIQVLVGTIRLDMGGQRIDVRQIFDPNFNGDQPDLALLWLAQAVDTSNPQIATIPINTDPAVPALQSTVWAAGWGGITADGSGTTDVLLYVDMPVVDCYATEDPTILICAGGIAGKDTCGGDSGGPLFVPTGPGTALLVGSTVGGSTVCGETGVHGIYMRLSAFLDWINRTMSTTTGSRTQLPLIAR